MNDDIKTFEEAQSIPNLSFMSVLIDKKPKALIELSLSMKTKMDYKQRTPI